MVISEVLLRVGPILALAVLNALIIHKFLKIARKRQALKGNVFFYFVFKSIFGLYRILPVGDEKRKGRLKKSFPRNLLNLKM